MRDRTLDLQVKDLSAPYSLLLIGLSSFTRRSCKKEVGERKEKA
jgi:hypothetical protein